MKANSVVLYYPRGQKLLMFLSDTDVEVLGDGFARFTQRASNSALLDRASGAIRVRDVQDNEIAWVGFSGLLYFTAKLVELADV